MCEDEDGEEIFCLCLVVEVCDANGRSLQVFFANN